MECVECETNLPLTRKRYADKSSLRFQSNERSGRMHNGKQPCPIISDVFNWSVLFLNFDSFLHFGSFVQLVLAINPKWFYGGQRTATKPNMTETF